MLTIFNLKWLATVRIRAMVNVMFSFKRNILVAASQIVMFMRLSLENTTT